MFQLIPKDTSFFRCSRRCRTPSSREPVLWSICLPDYRDVDKKIDEIRRIERQGDELTHAILTKLNQTFITLSTGKTFTSSPRSSMMFWTLSMLPAPGW